MSSPSHSSSRYASNLPPPIVPSCPSSTSQPQSKTSMHPPPSPSLSKTYGSLLSTSAPLACVSCSRPFPPDATLFPVKSNPNHDFFTHPEEEEKFKCRSCYSKEDSLGDCEACGRAVLGVKEFGSNERGEGMFVRSGKRLWCQGCFTCGGECISYLTAGDEKFTEAFVVYQAAQLRFVHLPPTLPSFIPSPPNQHARIVSSVLTPRPPPPPRELPLSANQVVPAGSRRRTAIWEDSVPLLHALETEQLLPTQPSRSFRSD